MKERIIEFFENNFSKLPKRIVVAVSGGLDSVALLFLLEDFCKKNNIKILSVTVDHKMRENSEKEALLLQKMLSEFGFNHEILEINKDDLPQKNIEAELREKRYDLIYEFCLKNDARDVFVGHHQNDLAENFLIRIFRGSQIDGLSAMNEVFEFKNVKIYRPLLCFQKSELKSFLNEKNISWFEDETNNDKKFLRNKIRKFLSDLDESDLVAKRIAKFSESLREEKQVLDEILLKNAKEILTFVKSGGFLIDKKKYLEAPRKIRQKILSLVLLEISGSYYKPRLEKLERFESDILNLPKGKKRDFYGCMSKILTKTNFDEVKKLILQSNFDKIKNDLENFIFIYSENENFAQKKEKFSDDLEIVDGKFLINKNGEKRFYFRTILKELYENY